MAETASGYMAHWLCLALCFVIDIILRSRNNHFRLTTCILRETKVSGKLKSRSNTRREANVQK